MFIACPVDGLKGFPGAINTAYPNTIKTPILNSGEHSLFREIKDVFSTGDVMLADSYYCSYFLIADHQARGVDVLFEQHGTRQTDFRRGEKLGARLHVVNWQKPTRPNWMSQAEYDGYPDELKVREVKVGKRSVDNHISGPSRSVEKGLRQVIFAALERRAGLEKHQDYFGNGNLKLQDSGYV